VNQLVAALEGINPLWSPYQTYQAHTPYSIFNDTRHQRLGTLNVAHKSNKEIFWLLCMLYPDTMTPSYSPIAWAWYKKKIANKNQIEYWA